MRRSKLLDLYGQALEVKYRRAILTMLVAASAISIVLDIVYDPLYEVFATVGSTGLFIYLGFLLLSAVHSAGEDSLYYRVLGWFMFLAGGSVLIIYVLLEVRRGG